LLGDRAWLVTGWLLAVGDGVGVRDHEHDRVASQEHLADEAVAVDGLRLLGALAGLGHLGPPLAHVDQHLHSRIAKNRSKY